MSDELNVNTRLAVDRTRLAYERTLMAWVRTSASLISFGFSVYKFFQFVRDGRHDQGGALGPRGFALAMITIGILALLAATIEHRRSMSAFRAEFGNVPRSLAAVVAGAVAGLGVVGLIIVLLHA